MKTRLSVAVIAGLIFAAIAGTGSSSAVTLVAGGSGNNNGADNGIHDTKKTQSADCINAATNQKEGTFVYNGPEYVWPPNHKYRTVTITLTDEDSETSTDTATVSASGRHDQMLEDGSEMNGAGNTDPATDSVPGAPGSGNPTATTTVQFRGERSGRDKTGRTYTFTAMGTTDNGGSTCKPVEFTATVPHDQRNHTNSGGKPGGSQKSASRASQRRAAKTHAAQLRAARRAAQR